MKGSSTNTECRDNSSTQQTAFTGLGGHTLTTWAPAAGMHAHRQANCSLPYFSNPTLLQKGMYIHWKRFSNSFLLCETGYATSKRLYNGYVDPGAAGQQGVLRGVPQLPLPMCGKAECLFGSNTPERLLLWESTLKVLLYKPIFGFHSRCPPAFF